MIVLDAEKAFDNIWYALKIKILSKLGIEMICLRLKYSLLRPTANLKQNGNLTSFFVRKAQDKASCYHYLYLIWIVF